MNPPLEKKCTQEFFHDLEGYLTNISKQIEGFLDLLKHDDAKLYEQLHRIIEDSSKELKNIKNFHDLVNVGKHIKISEPTLDMIFQIGAHHYSTGHYLKALLYFNWLCSVEGTNPQMWYLKGVAEQNLEHYNEALISFAQVISLDETFYHVYAQIMNCFVLMGNMKSAKEVYDSFIKDVDPSVYKDDKTFVENLHCIKEVV